MECWVDRVFEPCRPNSVAVAYMSKRYGKTCLLNYLLPSTSHTAIYDASLGLATSKASTLEPAGMTPSRLGNVNKASADLAESNRELA